MTTLPPGSPLPPPLTRRRPRWPLLIAAATVLGLLGYLLLGNANNNLVYYVLPTEYSQGEERFAGKTLRMGGLAKDVVYNRDTLDLRFNMTDGQTSYPVQYQGAVPDLFRNDAVVVMEGQMSGGTFHGKTLLVKHSEEYKAADGTQGSPGTGAGGVGTGTGPAKPQGSYSQEELKKILNDGSTSP